MTNYFQNEVNDLIDNIESANSSDEKGASFEELVTYYFSKIPGFTLIASNRFDRFGTGEIDRVFRNQRIDICKFLPQLLFIECKWGEQVDGRDVAWFDWKLRARGLRYGVLVATDGISGEPQRLRNANLVIASALRDLPSRRILVITLEELLILQNSLELLELLQTKIGELLITLTSA